RAAGPLARRSSARRRPARPRSRTASRVPSLAVIGSSGRHNPSRELVRITGAHAGRSTRSPYVVRGARHECAYHPSREKPEVRNMDIDSRKRTSVFVLGTAFVILTGSCAKSSNPTASSSTPTNSQSTSGGGGRYGGGGGATTLAPNTIQQGP